MQISSQASGFFWTRASMAGAGSGRAFAAVDEETRDTR